MRWRSQGSAGRVLDDEQGNHHRRWPAIKIEKRFVEERDQASRYGCVLYIERDVSVDSRRRRPFLLFLDKDELNSHGTTGGVEAYLRLALVIYVAALTDKEHGPNLERSYKTLAQER